jgi:hypothetical protein
MKRGKKERNTTEQKLTDVNGTSFEMFYCNCGSK